MHDTSRINSAVVTGATGFLGSELVRQLLLSGTPSIQVIIRSFHGMTAFERWRRVVEYWERCLEPRDVPPDALSRVKIVDYDLSSSLAVARPDLGQVDIFFHCAADTRFDLKLETARRANVFTTQNAVRLATYETQGLQRFVHFSTAFVLSMRKGMVDESLQPLSFQNSYEQTKFESEQVVRTSPLPFTIVRPSIVVGDSQMGYIMGFKVAYSVLRMWMSGILKYAPVDVDAKVEVVPVDYVIESALKLAQLPLSLGEVVHVCASTRAPSAGDFLATAVQTLGLGKAKIVPLKFIRWLTSPLGARLLTTYRVGQVIEVMRLHLPYFGSRDRVFCARKLQELIPGAECPDFEHYGQSLFQFCADTRWGRKRRVKLEGYELHPAGTVRS